MQDFVHQPFEGVFGVLCYRGLDNSSRVMRMVL